MNNNEKTTSNKENLQTVARGFLETLFSKALNQELGEIEIRTFPKGQNPQQHFFSSIDDAIEMAYNLSKSGQDVYFGVNPRKGKGGKKENIQYVVSFHAEIDYGSEGHKKQSSYQTYEEALTAINNFSPKPTIIIHSGGGFHCYFVLTQAVKVEEIGVDVLENINKAICLELGGDIGTHDLSRILRVPGTFNYKLPDNPRKVTVVENSGIEYDFNQLAQRFNVSEKVIENENHVENEKLIPDATPSPDNDQPLNITSDKLVAGLPVSEKIKSLILNGNDGTYTSRSEADMAVLKALVSNGITDEEIEEIFEKYPIGEKYREHDAPESYLQHSIKKAKTSMAGVQDQSDPIQCQNNKTFTATELLKEEFKPMVWAVDGIIPEGLSLLCGKPKTYKSWMALNIAIAVACGGIVFNYTSVKQGTVLYLALEDSKRRLQDRLKKTLNSIENHTLENLYLETNWHRIDDGGIEDLVNWIEDHPDTRVVIIDTLALIRPKNSSKNDYQSDYSTISKLKQVADRFNIAMIILHHLRKMVADDPFDQVSGTTGQTGSADTILVLQKGRVKTNAELIITGRDVEEKAYAMNFDITCWSWKVEGDAEEFRQSKERKEIIELIQSNGGKMKTKDITDALSIKGRKENTTRWMLGEMAKDGILQKPDRGIYEVITNNTNITNKQIIPTIPTNSNSSISLGLIPSNFVDDNNTNNK